MKRENLEERPYCTIIASSDFPFYAAPEADAVMDAYEARIKELESMLKDKDDAMNTCRGLIESANVMSKDAGDKLLNRIKELEAEVKKWKDDANYYWALVEIFRNGEKPTSTEMIAKANRLEKLEAENERLKDQVPKWISVKDRLPPEHKEIIGCTIKGNVMSCWFTEYARTHLLYWMLLPPPPTTEESSATEKENGFEQKEDAEVVVNVV